VARVTEMTFQGHHSIDNATSYSPYTETMPPSYKVSVDGH